MMENIVVGQRAFEAVLKIRVESLFHHMLSGNWALAIAALDEYYAVESCAILDLEDMGSTELQRMFFEKKSYHN